MATIIDGPEGPRLSGKALEEEMQKAYERGDLEEIPDDPQMDITCHGSIKIDVRKMLGIKTGDDADAK